MSGEQNPRPDLEEIIDELQQRLHELERRIEGDETEEAYLNDLADVRVDELVDATITLVDGSVLMYRASDKMWIPGAGGSGSSDFWTFDEFSDGRLRVNSATTPGITQVDIEAPGIFIRGDTADGIFLDTNDGGWITLDSDGGFDLSTNEDILIDAGSGSSMYVSINGELEITTNAGHIVLDAGTDILLDCFSGNVIVVGIPTSDPGVSGALWSSAGAVMISP